MFRFTKLAIAISVEVYLRLRLIALVLSPPSNLKWGTALLSFQSVGIFFATVDGFACFLPVRL